MAERTKLATPRRGAPETLWDMDRALRAYEVAAGQIEPALSREGDLRTAAVLQGALDVLAAHMPERQPGGRTTLWLGDVDLPEHAVCHGYTEGIGSSEVRVGCWDPDERPAAWPCPAVRPILDALGVRGDE